MSSLREIAVTLEQRITATEAELFAELGIGVRTSFLALSRTGLRVRVLEHGAGPPLMLLHGVSLSAAAWAPLFAPLAGYRVIAVEAPGHGLSDPFAYERGKVRAHARDLLDDIFDELDLPAAPVVGHSLGAMFALWHAARGDGRISAIAAVGDPAVALPGVRVRMPLSLLTVRGLGRAVLRSPSPPPVYRALLAKGLGTAEVAHAPTLLIEALRLAARRPGNARTVASLMHAIDRFRKPRPESTLTEVELGAITTPTTFIWGSEDPYLTPRDAHPSIDRMPSATLTEVPGGHGPWLVAPVATAALIRSHLESTERSRLIVTPSA
jgi:pimeloyl-ACP methyl ester carboxylesterase